MRRRVLICLIFATWCFLNTWVELAEDKISYFARYDPLRTTVLPVVCWEIAIALSMLGVWELYRKRFPDRAWGEGIFLIACFVPAGIASAALVRASPLDLTPLIHARVFWPVAVVAAASLMGYGLLHLRASARFMQTVFLWSWPALAVVLIQAGRATVVRHRPADYLDGPLAATLPSPPYGRRVVWIIFDELSQAIAFANRPAGLSLPNLDRLKSEAFYATSAVSPGGSTKVAIPALVLGDTVTAAQEDGPGKLWIQTRLHPQPFLWSSAHNVFDSARELGFNTALAGWYHPYGRLLNRSLTKCYWAADWLAPGVEEPTEPRPLARAMLDRARFQLTDLPLAGHIPGLSPRHDEREERHRRYSYLMNRALEIAGDPRIGLALIHLPVPHPPQFYDRMKNAIDVDGPAGYLDGVALADRALGLLRERIERAGLWDHTAVIVSADHGWRTNLWRNTAEWNATDEDLSHIDTSGVPFILKLPGQTEAVAYGSHFDTVVTKKLIIAILEGQLIAARQIMNREPLAEKP